MMQIVQFMKADFGSRYAARMALRHPLFFRQVYHMVKKNLVCIEKVTSCKGVIVDTCHVQSLLEVD